MKRSLTRTSSPSSPTRSSALSAAAAPARTTCSGWPDAGRCSTGPGRASTTSRRSGSPSSGISKRARRRARRGSGPSTPSPRRAWSRWPSTPAPPVAVAPVKSDALLRLLICDLVGEDVTRESLATLRDDVADLPRRLDDAERAARELPHRAKYLLLVVGFLRGLLDPHE